MECTQNETWKINTIRTNKSNHGEIKINKNKQNKQINNGNNQLKKLEANATLINNSTSATYTK